MEQPHIEVGSHKRQFIEFSTVVTSGKRTCAVVVYAVTTLEGQLAFRSSAPLRADEWGQVVGAFWDRCLCPSGRADNGSVSAGVGVGVM